MSHSLIPERMLVVSPSLAATIGLEEAIVLQALNDGARSLPSSIQINLPGKWSTLDKVMLRQWLPFWGDLDIKRILKSLSDKGVVQFSQPVGNPNSDQLFYSFELKQRPKAPATKLIKRLKPSTRPPLPPTGVQTTKPCATCTKP